MNTPSSSNPAPLPAKRLLYWSLRRELWENRSIYIAPLIVAGIALFGFFISTFRLASKVRAASLLAPEAQRNALARPFSLAASMILLTGIVAAVFYCLDALQSERRDRSILFWKSLPISDRMTVLSKAAVPIVVQPLVSIAIALSTQLLMLLGSTVVLMASRVSPAALWGPLPLLQMPLTMVYGVAIHVLWYAPLYGWLLLVSAWAKRLTILWASLPFFAVFAVEFFATGKSHLATLLKYRVQGAMIEGFTIDLGKTAVTRIRHLDPAGFLSAPGLWAGLLFTAACLAAAVRLRRNREPI